MASVGGWPHPYVHVDFNLLHDIHGENDFSYESASGYIYTVWGSALQVYIDGSKDPISGFYAYMQDLRFGRPIT